MRLPRSNHSKNTSLSLRLGVAMMLGVFASAQDIKLNVTYVCNGERIFVENCNIRDVSDTSTCMVGHPDHVRNGLMAYTTETRGTLKKLFPTCQQPSVKELAAAEAFKKKQQEIYDANVAKANPQPPPQTAAAQSNASGAQAAAVRPPKNAEERAMRRCVSSGRLPASCTGNALLGAFGQMISQVLPSATKEPPPGPTMAGVYQGAGNWRLDFIDGGVLVNCSFLSPNQESYKIDFRNNQATITVNTRPKPLSLTLRADGTMSAPGPFVLDGVVASGSSGGGSTPGHMETSTSTQSHVVSLDPRVSDQNLPLHPNTLTGTETTTTTSSTYVPGTPTAPQATFAPRRATCPALNLSTKGASVGIQTMQTDLLKTMFGGDKGAPTPPGIRMRGIFAASTGFSAQFFPESVILGCGPDAARAYPYTVVADGTKAFIKIDAPDHPLTLTFGPNGSLDAGSGPYQVHGRIVTGQNDDGDFTFVPMEQTCNLGALAPSTQIPSGGGSAAPMVAGSAGGTAATGAGPSNGGGSLSTPAAPLGNATLSIVSGFPAQPGTPNPLAGRPYVLLRDSYGDVLAKGGIAVPAGMSPFKYVATVCTGRTPDCQKIMDALKANAASAVKSDVSGAGTFPGVPPGTYYLMISTRVNNQPLVWSQAVQLKPGPNSLKLDQSNAAPLN
jgi:hypothetical protein